MPEIKITPLGAGQDVGRSCILLHIGGKNIMLDCGMHMGFKDERKFPDFMAITQGTGKTLTEYLDCVIISHFHLDHCGALPFMTEQVKYEGPIYMTHPTKAICPMLLEDMVRINELQKKERIERLNTPKDQLKLKAEEAENSDFFTSAQIAACMKRVTAVNLHQTTMVDKELEIKAYYAGHVLGAAMFRIRVGQQSVVYTGDYNMTPDRHLGAAWIDRCRPDLLITESTYATTIRDSKRCRERDFLKKIHECVDRGGKVLIPVFALGRAQELCILLETYWERMNIKAPIYFASGMTEKANHYYKMFITWTNQKIKRTFVKRNMFDFHHIKPFDKSYLANAGPMVVFATPGMLHAGLSLHIFKKWASNENNMIIMPGFCVNGTVGSKVVAGNKRVEIEGQMIDVKISVQYMSFSAHADAKGIMQLIHYCQPKNVLLVHGEASKMEFLKQKINQEFDIQCYMPANGETCTITTDPDIPVDVSLALMKKEEEEYDILPPDPKRQRLIHGVLIMKEDKLKIVDLDTAAKELNLPRHSLKFTEVITFREFGAISRTTDKIAEHLKLKLKDNETTVEVLSENEVRVDQGRVQISIMPVAKSDTEKEVSATWNLQVDLVKIAPGFNFIVRSRKGVCRLGDKIENIASKYVQKYRILVTVEQEIKKFKPRRVLKKRITVVQSSEDIILDPRMQEGQNDLKEVQPEPSLTAGILNLPASQAQLNRSSPQLIAALKRSIVSRRTPQSTTAAMQLQLLREIASVEQARIALEEFNNSYVPIWSSNSNCHQGFNEFNEPQYDSPLPGQRSPFPPFSSIKKPLSMNFETRVEKIDDYNVIQKSSVIWPGYGMPSLLPEYPMRCFSVYDEDFIL